MSNFIQSLFSIAKGIFECQINCILAFNNLCLITVNILVILNIIFYNLSTALAKNHAKPAKGDTSHVTKMNLFCFSQLIMT